MSIKCIVVTPEETALEQDCQFVVVPLFDGELGIGGNHSPLIGRLGFGELRIKDQSGNVDRYYVDAGFTQVAENTVTVLTGRLIPAGDLDASALESQLQEASERPSNTLELMELRERAVSQARAQIIVAQRANS